jgi:hypothetical protein
MSASLSQLCSGFRDSKGLLFFLGSGAMADHEGDILFFLYSEGIREKESLKGGIKDAIFVVEG